MLRILAACLLLLCASASAADPGFFLAYPKTAEPFFTQGIPRPFHFYVGQDVIERKADGSKVIAVKGHQPEKGLLAVHDLSMSIDKTFILYAHIRTFADSAREGMTYCDIFKLDLATRVTTQLTDSRHETIPPVGSNAWAKHDTHEHFLAVSSNGVNEPREMFTSTWNTAPLDVGYGKFVFTSTRDQIRTVKDSVASFALYLADLDGSNVERIDYFNFGGVMHPTRCADGSLLISIGATQGLRSGFVWTIWKINPDGTAPEPVISRTGFNHDYDGGDIVTSWHLQSQLSNRWTAALRYYNTRTSHGSIFVIPEFQATPFGPPTMFGKPLWSDNPRLPDGETSLGPSFVQMGFQPRGMYSLAPWATSADATAFVNGDPMQTVPDLGWPAAGLNNSLYLTTTGDRRVGGGRESWGIHKVPDATQPVAAYTDMQVVVDDPDVHEWNFQPLLSHQEIYGSAFPQRTAPKSERLPAGSAYFQIGWGAVDQSEITEQIHPNKRPAEMLTYPPDSAEWVRVIDFRPTTNFRSESANGFQSIEEGNSTPPVQVNNYEGFHSLPNERMAFYEQLIPVKHWRTPTGQLYSGPNPPPGSTRIMRPDGRPDTSGSAFVLANQCVGLQLLDKDFQAIFGATSQHWLQGRPGEKQVSCRDCHKHWSPSSITFEQTVAGSDEYQPLKLSTTKLVEFTKDVKPILDQHGLDWGPRPWTKVRAYHSQVAAEDDDPRFTDAQKRTIREWFDSGSMTAGRHSDGTPILPGHGVGPFADTMPPTLVFTAFADRVTLAAGDPQTGINESSLSVKCSVPIAGRAANAELIDLFVLNGDVRTLMVTPPIDSTWTVVGRDNARATNSAGQQVSESGNITRFVKTVKALTPPPVDPPPTPKAIYLGLDGDYVGPERQNSPNGKLDHHIQVFGIPAGIQRWNVHGGGQQWSSQAEIPIVQVRPFPPSPLGVFDLRFEPRGTEAVTEFRVFAQLPDGTDLLVTTTLPPTGSDVAALQAQIAALQDQVAAAQGQITIKDAKITEQRTKLDQINALSQ